MVEAVARWVDTFADAGPVSELVLNEVRRPGKRLRPRTAIGVCDLLGGDPVDVCSVGASVEFYHRASMVFDDVQDTAASRDGQPALHVTTDPSTAVNVAGIIRSMSYHVLTGDTSLPSPIRERVRTELDVCSTLVPLGQSMDIGWRRGWFVAQAAFPYESMVRRKTGALFRYAAWSAAFVVTGDEGQAAMCADLGAELGTTYQFIDDYIDTFDAAGVRPDGDAANARASLPLMVLLDTLDEEGRHDVIRVIHGIAGQVEPDPAGSTIVSELLTRYGIATLARARIADSLRSLTERVSAYGGFAVDRPLASMISSMHELLERSL